MMGLMKTTVELPDQLLACTKAYAKERGKSFREVLIEALNLLVLNGKSEPSKPGWEALFGAFAHEKEETDRIQAMIDEEFNKIDPEDWE